jgi:hypothetical protein
MANVFPGRLIESVNGQVGVVYIQEDRYYIHEQGTPASSWTIQHDLGKKPSVTIIDSANTVVEGQIEYINDNIVTLTFNGAFSGKAIFN